MTWIGDQPRSICQWRAAYRHAGLPVRFSDNYCGVEVVTDEWTTALTMPASLGRAVFQTACSTAPVLQRPPYKGVAERWRFFAWFDRAPAESTTTILDAAGVALTLRGTPIMLPTHQPDLLAGQWVRTPGGDLPTTSELIGTILAVLSRRATRFEPRPPAARGSTADRSTPLSVVPSSAGAH